VTAVDVPSHRQDAKSFETVATTEPMRLAPTTKAETDHSLAVRASVDWGTPTLRGDAS
jgi:hypothetical protein